MLTGPCCYSIDNTHAVAQTLGGLITSGNGVGAMGVGTWQVNVAETSI